MTRPRLHLQHTASSKPGFLSAEQLRGSRVRYAKPYSLLLSINVIYYLSIALFGANTFTSPLSVRLTQNDYYPGFAMRQVERQVRVNKTGFAMLETKYNETTNVLSKTLIFLFIPIYAAIFYGLFRTRLLDLASADESPVSLMPHSA